MANRRFECGICKIFTTDQASLDSHFLGSKHQLALHRNLVKEKKEKSGIYVTGFFTYTKTDAIQKFFSQFGKIADFHLGPNNSFAIIEYSDAHVAQNILNTRLIFQGRYLNIKPRIVKTSTTIFPQKQEPEFAKIYAEVTKHQNFQSQLQVFVKTLQVHEKYLEPPAYNKVCADLHYILLPQFPNCRVLPFGSTVSGLGFINSDIDIYVDVVTPLGPSSSSESPAAIYTRKARKLLDKSGLFRNAIAIPKAKTPIVKAVHKQTGINCDINFKNILGVCNSNLIKFFLTLDVRVRPFMFIIKYWAKINELSGSGKFSNYAIVMLAIFYLQREPYPILPPIKTFLGPNKNNVEDWNVNFTYNLNNLPKTLNNLGFRQILLGFFSFWTKFDFGFNVICPLTGDIIPRSDFSTAETLPNSFDLYKDNLRIHNKEPLKIDTVICLQDPIELNHNITAIVSPRLLEDFRKLCEISANIINTSEPKDILPKLLLKLEFEKAVTINDNSCVFKISSTTVILPEILSKGDPKNIQKRWFDKINQFLGYVLEKLLLFEVKPNKEVHTNKYQKLNGQTDIHDSEIVESITFHCVGYNNVWEARKSISKNFEMKKSESILDNEIAISNYIVNVLCKGVQIKNPIVDFYLTLNCKADPTEAEFVLNNFHSKKNCFKVMATYFANRIPSLCGHYFKELQNVNVDENIESKIDEIKKESEKVTI